MKMLMVFIFFTTPLCTQDSQSKGLPKRYYAAVFSSGEYWDTTKQPHEQTHFSEHGKNLQRLKAEG